MSALDLIPLVLTSVMLLFTVINAITIWRPADTSVKAGVLGSSEELSLLIPMRNESANIEGLLRSLDQIDEIANLEVIALDDQSSDGTGILLRNANRSYLRVIDGAPLPSGWLGKPHALQQLLDAATRSRLVFIDADLRLEPGGIASALDLMEREGWRFVSPYPRQLAGTFMERMVQPLLQWSWFSSVPLRFAARRKIPSMAVGNGQFLAIEKSALEEIGGFESVKSDVLEDIELIRALWRAGIPGSVIEGSNLARCRMYQSNLEVVAGYTKSLWRAFGSPFGALLTALLLVATSWLPLILGLSGSPWGWLSFFLISLSRLISSLATRSFWQGFLLHPISVAIVIYMIALSFLKKSRGAITWRDRVITP